jgi:hypothetical protein
MAFLHPVAMRQRKSGQGCEPAIASIAALSDYDRYPMNNTPNRSAIRWLRCGASGSLEDPIRGPLLAAGRRPRYRDM